MCLGSWKVDLLNDDTYTEQRYWDDGYRVRPISMSANASVDSARVFIVFA